MRVPKETGNAENGAGGGHQRTYVRCVREETGMKLNIVQGSSGTLRLTW